jgi:hypothetical protein
MPSERCVYTYSPSITLADDDIIERECVEDPAARTQDLGRQHEAGLLDVVPREDPCEGVDRILATDIREESEPSLIHTHERNTVFRQTPRRIEHGSVAAEHHRKVGVLADLFVRRNRKIPRHADGTCRTLLDPYGVPSLAQMIGNEQHRLGDVRALIFADKRDGLEGMSHGFD